MHARINVPLVRNVERDEQIVVLANRRAPLIIGITVVYPDRQFFPGPGILREPDRVVLLIVRRITECRNRTIRAAKRRAVRADCAEQAVRAVSPLTVGGLSVSILPRK